MVAAVDETGQCEKGLVMSLIIKETNMFCLTRAFAEKATLLKMFYCIKLCNVD